MLTLQFVQYTEIEPLDSEERIRKLLNLVKQDKIVILEGRLKEEEEAELIKSTMKKIDKTFKGIELGVIYPDEKSELNIFKKLHNNMLDILLGNRRGLTIIGPATIIKEIKQDPKKIQLLTTIKSKKFNKPIRIKKWKSKSRKR